MKSAETNMTGGSAEQSAVRKYLLGTLTDKEKLRLIEKQILLDDNFGEILSIAEDDLIEEYLEANLRDDEIEQFERFFLSSPERRARFRFITSLRKYAVKTSVRATEASDRKSFRFFDWQRLYLPPQFRFAAITLVFCCLGFGIAYITFYESDLRRGNAELRAAYHNGRPFESRLSLLDYAPFSSVRGSNDVTDEIRLRDSAARKLFDAAQNKPGAESLHALGNYYLTGKEFEKAVSEFDAALKLDPNKAQLYNDYGVALLEKAKQIDQGEQSGERLKTLARANEYFTKAVELNASLLEAVFNRALTLEQMNVPEQAKKAWREYLEKDSSSPWAVEARKNLQKLESQASSAKPPAQVLHDFLEAFERRDERRAWEIVAQSKEMISDTMVFFQLTRDFLASDAASQTPEAEKYLAAMQFVGKMEREQGGDFYFAELADFYSSSRQSDRKILLQANNQVKKGYLLSQNSKYSEAITVLREAKELFARTGNIWESNLSDYWLGFLLDRTGKTQGSLPDFLALENFCRQRKHKWLAAQSLGWLFNSALARSEYSKALNYLNAALQITRENSDTYNQQKFLAQLGNYYSRLGELQKALKQIEESRFTRQSYFSSDRQSWRNCLFAAETLHKLKLYNSAISFGQEALHIGSEKITEATANHTSYYMLAQLYGGSGKYSEAIDYAQKSLLSVQSVNEEDRRLLSNYSHLRTANLYRQAGDCGAALKIYSIVIEETASKGGVELELNNYEAHKGQLLCYFALEQETSIEEELAVVLTLYEKFRAQISEEQTRNVFFDDEQNVYDLAVDFKRSRNKIQNAFETAEISKARSLLDSFQTHASLKSRGKELTGRLDQVARPLALDEIQRRLPEQVQIVQYAVLPDKIIIWVITRTQFHLIEKKIAAIEISRLVENYLEIITENKFQRKDNTAEESRLLYQTLISPILPLLDANKAICIVPDKMLYRLPFAALVAPASSRFLIEDYTVFSAPSAAMLILSSEAAVNQKCAPADEKILSIGNPNFDKQEFPDLPDLPDAEQEAVKIAAFYKTAKTLIGKAADKQAVLNEFAESNVFHFAGHYAVNESSPLRSKLLLTAKGKNQSSDIEVDEILGQNLGSIKLAVLSACRTGTENYYSGEGMYGIARSFLAGGVPLVIGSQWAVDSDATAELMTNFHRYRKQHQLSSAKALRRAQLDMLNSSDERLRLPYYWAGFLPIGGYTEN